MNPSIILGICAGMALYVVLRTLVGGRRIRSASDCAGKVLPSVVKDREAAVAPSVPTAAVTEVPDLETVQDAGHVESDEEETAREAPELPATGGKPKSSLSVAFSGAKRKQWFLVKSTTGAVRVCQALERTPKTIAGPFATKEEAYRAKES